MLWKSRFSRTSSRSSSPGLERVEAVAALAQLRDLLLRDPRAGAPGGVALEQGAQVVEVVQVVRRVHADHRSAVRRGIDLALDLEHQQRLADRRPADPELPGELLLLQTLPRLEPAVEDRLSDQLGRGHARVPHQPLAVSDRSSHGTKIQYAIRHANAVTPHAASIVRRTGPGAPRLSFDRGQGRDRTRRTPAAR